MACAMLCLLIEVITLFLIDVGSFCLLSNMVGYKKSTILGINDNQIPSSKIIAIAR